MKLKAGTRALAHPGATKNWPNPKPSFPDPAMPSRSPQCLSPKRLQGRDAASPDELQQPSGAPKKSGSPAKAISLHYPLHYPCSPQPWDSQLAQPSNPRHYPTPYEGSLQHQLYPTATWHSQRTDSTPHTSAFHCNTKLLSCSASALAPQRGRQRDAAALGCCQSCCVPWPK